MHSRSNLYRKLVNELSFSMLLGNYLKKQMGIALVFHDRNKVDLRRMSIVHIGTYKTEDLQEFIVTVANFIFRKDPCAHV